MKYYNMLGHSFSRYTKECFYYGAKRHARGQNKRLRERFKTYAGYWRDRKMIKDNQRIVSELHLAFKEAPKSEELEYWNKFINVIAEKHFTPVQQEAFYDVLGSLLNVFATDCITFLLDYFENWEGKTDE